MFLNSLREVICFEMLKRISTSCGPEFLRSGSQVGEASGLAQLEREVAELELAIAVAAERGDVREVPKLEECHKELMQRVEAERLRAELADQVDSASASPSKPPIRLFAIKARLNLAFANLYVELDRLDRQKSL